MTGIKKKIKLSKRFSSYEQRYSLLYKYPRKSTIHEYYIKNNFLHKIRLSSDIDGLDRLRERSKRINYFEVSSKGVKNNHLFNSNDPQNKLKQLEKTGSKTTEPPVNIAVRPQVAKLKTNYKNNLSSEEPFAAPKSGAANKMTRVQRYQNRLALETKKVNASSCKLEKDEKKRPYNVRLMKPSVLVCAEDKKPIEETAVITENRKNENEEGDRETLCCSKSISITLKEIKQISAGHKCLMQEFPNKQNYCSICDMKLNKYIDQKRVLFFNVLNCYTCAENNDINVKLPIVAVKNGFKLRYIHLIQDYFTYRAT